MQLESWTSTPLNGKGSMRQNHIYHWPRSWRLPSKFASNWIGIHMTAGSLQSSHAWSWPWTINMMTLVIILTIIIIKMTRLAKCRSWEDWSSQELLFSTPVVFRLVSGFPLVESNDIANNSEHHSKMTNANTTIPIPPKLLPNIRPNPGASTVKAACL